MNITVVGAGYIGLTSGVIFADLGNTVWVIRRDQKKIDDLKKGISPIYEPGIEEMIRRNLDAGRLIPTTEYADAVRQSDVVFICVGTPSSESGEADLTQVKAAAEEIAKHLTDYTVVVNKSTVPVGTGELVKGIISKGKPATATFDVVSCPEFLREGTAVRDSLEPDRVVIGYDSQKALDVMIELHKPLPGERIITDVRTAEMIKYAANSLLATEISFINDIATLCEKLGADVTAVARGVRGDKRIGPHAFLDAGIGYGGGCFPKDVKALIALGDASGVSLGLLKEGQRINAAQRQRFIEKIKNALPDMKGKTIAVWGLAFKPNTDDMREAPSVDIIHALQTAGAIVRAYDPVAEAIAKKILPDITYCHNVYETVTGADALVIITEWNEFKEVDLARVKAVMASPLIIDGRNVYNPSTVRDLGFTYLSVGRS